MNAAPLHARLALFLVVPFIISFTCALFPLPQAWGVSVLPGISAWTIVMTMLPIIVLLVLWQRTPSTYQNQSSLLPPALLAILWLILSAAAVTVHFHGAAGIPSPDLFTFLARGLHSTSTDLPTPTMLAWAGTLVQGPTVVSMGAVDSVLPHAYVIVSAAALGVLTAAWWMWLRHEHDGGASLLLLLLGGSGTLLLLGYPSNRILPYALLISALLAATRSLHCGTSRTAASLLALAALALDLSLIALLPAAVAFHSLHSRSGTDVNTTRRAVIHAAISAASLLVVLFLLQYLGVFTHAPLREVFSTSSREMTEVPGIVSLRHLLDLGNVLALTAPVPVLTLLMIAVTDRTAFRARSSVIAGVSSCCAFGTLVIATPENTLSWDLDRTAVLGVTCALWSYTTLLASQRFGRRAARIAGIAAALYAVPHLVVMTDTGMAIGRFAALVRLEENRVPLRTVLSGYSRLNEMTSNAHRLAEITFLRRRWEETRSITAAVLLLERFQRRERWISGCVHDITWDPELKRFAFPEPEADVHADLRRWIRDAALHANAGVHEIDGMSMHERARLAAFLTVMEWLHHAEGSSAGPWWSRPAGAMDLGDILRALSDTTRKATIPTQWDVEVAIGLFDDVSGQGYGWHRLAQLRGPMSLLLEALASTDQGSVRAVRSDR